jgi:hypothetical protein
VTIQRELRELGLLMRWKFWRFLIILTNFNSLKNGPGMRIFSMQMKNTQLKAFWKDFLMKNRKNFTSFIADSRIIGTLMMTSRSILLSRLT